MLLLHERLSGRAAGPSAASLFSPYAIIRTLQLSVDETVQVSASAAGYGIAAALVAAILSVAGESSIVSSVFHADPLLGIVVGLSDRDALEIAAWKEKPLQVRVPASFVSERALRSVGPASSCLRWPRCSCSWHASWKPGDS